MAATTAGALKQLVESFGLGLAAYRDRAPVNAAMPYVIIQDGITARRVPGGDAGEGDMIAEECQLDLYERWYAPNGTTIAESATLAKALGKALHGSAPTSSGADTTERIYGVRVPFSSRSVDADDNTVRTRYRVDVHRAQ
jgi:hypothetical protein